MSDALRLQVTALPSNGSHDDASSAAAQALDDVAGWFADDGYTLGDWIDAATAAYERVTE